MCNFMSLGFRFMSSILSKKQNPFLGGGVQSAQNAVDCELRQVKKKNNKFLRNATQKLH